MDNQLLREQESNTNPEEEEEKRPSLESNISQEPLPTWRKDDDQLSKIVSQNISVDHEPDD